MSPEPRRLLAVSHTGLFSGAERVLVNHLDAARAAGWDVSAASPEGTLAVALRDRRIPVAVLPDLKLGDGPRPLAALRMVGRWFPAARTLRRAARGTDRVLVNGLLALPATRLARLDATVCWLIHDVVVRRDFELVGRFGAKGVDRAIAVSDAAGAMARRLGLDVVVARNGARWPVEPATVPGPGARPIVGINAMVTPWKGHAVLLDAMAAVPDADLEVLGGHFPKDGDHVAALQDRAAAPDLAGRVRFLGHRDDPLAAMRHWTVAVNASVDPEAAPLSVLEAMSLGLPIVATDHGGTPEVLGDAGLLVPPRDAPAMADALRVMLGDASLRARCRAAGPATIAAGLTLDATAAHFLDVLEGARR